MQKLEFFLRFLRFARDPLWRSAWLRCKNIKNSRFCWILAPRARPSARICVVEVHKLEFLRFAAFHCLLSLRVHLCISLSTFPVHASMHFTVYFPRACLYACHFFCALSLRMPPCISLSIFPMQLSAVFSGSETTVINDCHVFKCVRSKSIRFASRCACFAAWQTSHSLRILSSRPYFDLGARSAQVLNRNWSVFMWQCWRWSFFSPSGLDNRWWILPSVSRRDVGSPADGAKGSG